MLPITPPMQLMSTTAGQSFYIGSYRKIYKKLKKDSRKLDSTCTMIGWSRTKFLNFSVDQKSKKSIHTDIV
jgi:hypothetical protein